MTETTTDSNAETESPKLLVVEDERDLADLYAAWLADSYTVKTAYDGEEALDKLDESIDVVLLDRRMPGLSGDEVLTRIRGEGLDVRVAVVSAVTPNFDVIDMGFDTYLTKPVDKDDLHETVEQMLRRGEYDEIMQTYQQLVATKAALEEQKSDAELQGSNEYTELKERIAAVQTRADNLIEDFTTEDFEVAVRDLDTDAPDGPANDEDNSFK